MAEPDVKEVRKVSDSTSPVWRGVCAILVAVAVLLLAQGLQLQGALQLAATVFSVAALHVATAMSQRRSDDDYTPEAPEPIAGQPAAVALVRRKSARLGAAFLKDNPWAARWVGRGSLAVEIIKGLASGALTVGLQQLISGATQSQLGEEWALILSVTLSVTIIHMISVLLSAGTRREVQVNHLLTAMVEEAPILKNLLTPQWPVRDPAGTATTEDRKASLMGLAAELIKGFMKGSAVLVLRFPLLAIAAWFTNLYFAGAAAALIGAAIFAPVGTIPKIVHMLTSTKKKETAS